MVWLKINRWVQWVSFLGCFGLSHLFGHTAEVMRDVCVVVGAQGEAEYGETFRTWAKRWEEAFDIQSGPQATRFRIIDGSSKQDSDTVSNNEDREQLLKWIGEPFATQDLQPALERWLVLIGHGTYERGTPSVSGAKFNMRGGDLTPELVRAALNDKSIERQPPTRWNIVICSSCSGPFLPVLSAPGRTIITATKSGSEQNFSRFGGFLSQALTDPKADLDHDNSISLLEAFLMAGNQTEEFYQDDARLASEQALLDDNADKRGTPASFFQGTRPLKAPAENLELDGFKAKRLMLAKLTDEEPLSESQRIAVEVVEDKLEAFRSRKSELTSEDYYHELESLFREIAKVRGFTPISAIP